MSTGRRLRESCPCSPVELDGRHSSLTQIPAWEALAHLEHLTAIHRLPRIYLPAPAWHIRIVSALTGCYHELPPKVTILVIARTVMLRIRCRVLILGWLAGMFAGARYSSAQYAGNSQTNIISGVVSNWTGDYLVGSNTFADALLIQNGGVLSNGNGYLGYEIGADTTRQ